MKRIIQLLGLCYCLIFISCGSISAQTAANDTADDGEASVNSDVSSGNSQIFVFATDFQSSGQLYVATLLDGETILQNSGVTLLGTEAVIRYHGNLLYILHAGGNFNSVSTDNLQILDPFDGFATQSQFSTGNGTNPMDVVISGSSAFITLYNPEANGDNVDSDGNPGDVIEMSTNTGTVKRRYSFSDYLQDDGDKNGHAYCLLLVDTVLYVCLQDLESTTFSPTAPGLIGMIDIVNDEILGVITLQGRNPSSLAVSNDRSKLFVGMTHDFSYDADFGGLEVIDLETLQSEVFIKDSNFGGYIEKLKVAEEKIFATVSRFDASTFVFESKIVSFPEGISASSDIGTYKSYSTDIRDIFVQNEFIWVSYRVISTSTGDSDPALKVFDVDTGDQIGDTVNPVVAGISLTGL